jgi:DNA-binding NarL/FixJ family response regulator
LISRQPGVACSGAYSSADEVPGNVPAKEKTLWLVNRSLPEKDGTDFIREIDAQAAQSCGLFYSIHEDSEQLFATSPGGAVAYLFRRTAANRILEPLLGQMSAILPLSFKKVSSLARHYFHSSIAAALPAEPVLHLEKLTHREHEILQLLSKGLLDKEIADKLRISIWTVHGHVKKIFRKLQVHSRTEAVVTYLQK